MIINNLLSIPIYEFQCDESLIDEIYKQATLLDFTKNTTNSISSQNYFYNEELFKWFDQCIQQVREIYFLDSVSLPIISCWVNKSSKLERHHEHQHPNSVLSGILYLTTHNKAETIFYYNSPYFELGNSNLFLASKNLKNTLVERPCSINGKVKPKKGKLILFPSSLVHGTRPNTDSYNRYTISFNTFFSGESHHPDGKGVASSISLTPITVQQLHER